MRLSESFIVSEICSTLSKGFARFSWVSWRWRHRGGSTPSGQSQSNPDWSRADPCTP